CTRRKRLAYW
nr:immunoglobulin heavy chain junction region [Mus musculus]MBK4196323.1 immunoglobulin heavy chain junction region [Mus musculus]